NTSSGTPPDLHSSPARRSSDLGRIGADMELELARLRVRWQRVVAVATRSIDAQVREAGEAVYGAMGAPASVQDVAASSGRWRDRSEEHTSELQSRGHLVCRLLL